MTWAVPMLQDLDIFGRSELDFGGVLYTLRISARTSLEA